MSGIDRSSGDPLYAQIATDLRSQIESGVLTPGSPLPPEQALQQIYGVSRSVVRQALDRLAQDRLIHREQGRGTTVLPPHNYHRRAQQAGGLRQQIAAMGGELDTRTVSLDLVDAPPSAQDHLGAGRAWRLERVRSVDGEPMIHMVTWIPSDIAPSLTIEGLNGGSLHEWMRQHGLDPRGGPRQLRAVAAEEDTAAFLDVTPGSPVTLLEGITRDASGQTIEVFSAWHHPNTVFDLDAEVRPAQVERAEELLTELRSLIARA